MGGVYMADEAVKKPWYKSGLGIAILVIVLLSALGLFYKREMRQSDEPVQEAIPEITQSDNSRGIPLDEDTVEEPGKQDTIEGIKMYMEEKYEEAKDFLEKAAEEGNADAKALLGKMYIFGHGVVKDTKKGLEYLEDAVERGSSYAMSELGTLYIHGKDGVEHAADKGMELINRAIGHGKYYGYLAMAKLYEAGESVEQSTEKAISYLEQAGENGYRYAKDEIEKLREKL